MHANMGAPAGSPCVGSVAWSPDGELLATGCSDGFAKVWNARANRCERSFQASPENISNVRSVEFSPGGLSLVTGTEDGVVALWDVMTGQGKIILDYDGPGLRQVTFTPGPLMVAEDTEKRQATNQSRAGSKNRDKSK